MIMKWFDASLPILELRSTQGNPEVTFTPLQLWMFDHIGLLQGIWWAVWLVCLAVLVRKTFIEKKFS